MAFRLNRSIVGETGCLNASVAGVWAVALIPDQQAALPAPVPEDHWTEIAIDGGVTVRLPGDIPEDLVIMIAGGLSRCWR